MKQARRHFLKSLSLAGLGFSLPYFSFGKNLQSTDNEFFTESWKSIRQAFPLTEKRV